jgi:ABC-type sugar transport system ATPase subunit
VLISHYLNEIFEVCDDLTVMRDGRIVADGPVAETSLPAVVTQMIGRSLDVARPERAARARGATLLEVEDLSVPGRLRSVSLTLGEGEILGITGLAGSGLTDLAKSLFGAGERSPSSGRITVAGRPARIGGPADALAAGIALLTNDRLREGILPDFTLIDNVCLAVIDRFGAFSDRRGMRAATEAAIRRLHVRTRGPDAPARQLSGGNQQKLLLAKWLETTPRIFVLDEPTIGVDVGSKEEIRAIIRDIVAGGTGVILITAELAELEALCDRVLVMFRGAIVATLEGDAVEGRAILQASVSGRAPTS